MRANRYIVCEHCDVVYERAAVSRRQRALCLRCGAELYGGPVLGLEAMFALTLAALIVFVIANAYPLITMQMNGVQNHSTLWGAIRATWATGVGPVAVLSAVTVFLFPLAQILALGYLLGALLRGREPAGFVDLMHALREMRRWSMVEVLLIGALVAVVKIGGLADVDAGIGLYALGALTLLLTLLNAFDLRLLWDARERLRA